MKGTAYGSATMISLFPTLRHKRCAASKFTMLKVRPFYIITQLAFIAMLSCGRVKQKSLEVVDNTKTKLSEKKAALEDKLVPYYDAYNPDTKFNKKRFEEFFGFAPTADVTAIYCHADEMGIDHDYQFSFRCDTSTVSKIVNHLKLMKAERPDSFSRGLWHNFAWWDSTGIATLKPYVKKGDHDTFWYLWYAPAKSKAYYFEFDM